MNSPKKLLLSKWTAVKPTLKEKNFLVTKVFPPELPGDRVHMVELEAVYSNRVMLMDSRALLDETVWRQGWW